MASSRGFAVAAGVGLAAALGLAAGYALASAVDSASHSHTHTHEHAHSHGQPQAQSATCAAGGGGGGGGSAVGERDAPVSTGAGHGHSHSPGHSHAHTHGHGGAPSPAGEAGSGGEHAHAHAHAHGVPSFEDAVAWAARFDVPEREAWLQPATVIEEVLAPLVPPPAAGAGSGRPVVADIGAGTGFFTVRLAAALPHAIVVATDPEDGMRAYTARRARDNGLTNVQVTAAGTGRMGLPARATLALLCTVYHHIDDRVAYLRASAAQDLVPGGLVVVIEHKTGDLPIPTPPPAMRFERSVIVAEFEAAGFTVVGAPAILPYYNILVFQAPAVPAAPAAV